MYLYLEVMMNKAHLLKLAEEIHNALSPEAKVSAEAFAAAIQAGEAMTFAMRSLERASELSKEYKSVYEQMNNLVDELSTIVEAHHKVISDRVIPDIEKIANNYVKEINHGL
jgi:hypothetical protein